MRENIMHGVKKPKEDSVVKKKKEIVFLTDDEMNALYNECQRQNTEEFACTGKPGTPFYSKLAYGIVFIMETGLRAGELLALQYQDVDLKNKSIYVRRNLSRIVLDKKETYEVVTPKTKTSIRNLPLTDKAFFVLDKILEGRDLKPTDPIMMDNKGGLSNVKNMNRTLKNMLKRAGCNQDCTIHGLRHSFASRALRHGVKVEVLSKYLGHSDVSTTMNVYIHIIESQKMQEIEKLNNI